MQFLRLFCLLAFVAAGNAAAGRRLAHTQMQPDNDSEADGAIKKDLVRIINLNYDHIMLCPQGSPCSEQVPNADNTTAYAMSSKYTQYLGMVAKAAAYDRWHMNYTTEQIVNSMTGDCLTAEGAAGSTTKVSAPC